MAKRTVPEFAAEFFATLGQLVVYWNRIDTLTQMLIRAIHHENAHKTEILTAHMGSTGLCDALRTLSMEFASEEIRSHIFYYINFLEILREYRNYYVHAFIGFENGSAIMQSVSARSRLMLHRASVTADEMQLIADHCQTLTNYGLDLHECLAKENEHSQQRPLPERPPLPHRLKKPRLPLRGE